jgi:hypothetical protein
MPQALLHPMIVTEFLLPLWEQRWQPLEDERWGRVVGREGAER